MTAKPRRWKPSSLVWRSQEYLKNLRAFLGLPLKAQAQSRVTISALVDLKYPRQATLVKRANIAHGLQQLNHGAAAGNDPAPSAKTHARGRKRTRENKLWEAEREQPGKRIDAERRKRQSEDIKRCKPWNQFTGPKALRVKRRYRVMPWPVATGHWPLA